MTLVAGTQGSIPLEKPTHVVHPLLGGLTLRITAPVIVDLLLSGERVREREKPPPRPPPLLPTWAAWAPVKLVPPAVVVFLPRSLIRALFKGVAPVEAIDIRPWSTGELCPTLSQSTHRPQRCHNSSGLHPPTPVESRSRTESAAVGAAALCAGWGRSSSSAQSCHLFSTV